jgi:hypothetical protein
MLIHHLRMTTSGAGGNMSHRLGRVVVAKPHRRIIGNGITSAVYDTDLGVIKPTRLLQHIKIKKSVLPKKYISFD